MSKGTSSAALAVPTFASGKALTHSSGSRGLGGSKPSAPPVDDDAAEREELEDEAPAARASEPAPTQDVEVLEDELDRKSVV
jgi:hypothetical protein